MRRAVWALTVLFAACPALCGEAKSGATVTRRDDGGFLAVGRTYRAIVNEKGGWDSLSVEGVEVFGGKEKRGAPFPGTGSAAVNLHGNLLAVRHGSVRVEYTFDETGVGVETEGAALNLHLSEAVTALVQADGGTAEGKTGGVGDVRKVIAGRTAFALDQPFHCMSRRMVPSHLCGRGGKPETLFKFRIECGVSTDPVELLAIESLHAPGQPPHRVPFFTREKPPVFELNVKNLGATETTAEVAYRLLDHDHDAREVRAGTLSCSAEAGGRGSVKIETPVAEPGCYWLHVELRKDGKAAKREQLGLVFEADRYLPPLTRPDDFKAFWEGKLKSFRATPFDEKLSENAALTDGNVIVWDVELTGPDGKRVKTLLMRPRKEGACVAELNACWSYDRLPAQFAKLRGKPEAKDRLYLGYPMPEEATFRRWGSRDDNNMLDCILLAVRLTDYLRTRKDVSGIFLRGASRSGPLALIAAALDSSKVLAVDAHVPTSCGISWSEKPYRGWGQAPETLRAAAAYFDPVNFAPDLRVPFMLDGGVFDGLSPVPGILALHNHAVNASWKRVSIEKGGHGYFPPDFRKKAHADLEVLLKTAARGSVDERILKEH